MRRKMPVGNGKILVRMLVDSQAERCQREQEKANGTFATYEVSFKGLGDGLIKITCPSILSEFEGGCIGKGRNGVLVPVKKITDQMMTRIARSIAKELFEQNPDWGRIDGTLKCDGKFVAHFVYPNEREEKVLKEKEQNRMAGRIISNYANMLPDGSPVQLLRRRKVDPEDVLPDALMPKD